MFLYILRDPVTKEICYAGKTENVATRHKQHCKFTRARRSEYHGEWSARLCRLNKAPLLEVVEEIICDADHAAMDEWRKIGHHCYLRVQCLALEKEGDLIRRLWAEGHPLVNLNHVVKITGRIEEVMQKTREYRSRIENSQWYRDSKYTPERKY